MILLMEDSPEDEALTRRALKKNNTENMVFFMRDGLEVLRRLGADVRTRLLPVVILTSSNEERDLIEGYKSGANSYIRKPVDFDQFLEAVRSLAYTGRY